MTTTQITPQVLQEFQPGAILYDSWGYEQTNIDFYCIVDRRGAFVVIMPMKKNSEDAGNMTTKDLPTEIDYDGKPIMRKVKSFSGKESGFTLRGYTSGGWVSLWDGRPKYASHYA